MYGGASCEAEYRTVQTTRSRLPGKHACPAEDCQGEWEQDAQCQAGLCSEGAEIGSTYVITKERVNGGASCEAESGATKTEPCPDVKCPAEDCQGYWEQDRNLFWSMWRIRTHQIFLMVAL